LPDDGKATIRQRRDNGDVILLADRVVQFNLGLWRELNLTLYDRHPWRHARGAAGFDSRPNLRHGSRPVSGLALAFHSTARGVARSTRAPMGQPSRSWILEPSATGLCKPDLHVFAKLFEDCLKRGLEAQAFSGREIGSDDDVLNFLVGHFVDVDLTRQPAS
jgi:hypothetical protein